MPDIARTRRGQGFRVHSMEIIRGLHNLKPRHRGGVVTIGSFDGVHHGHQMLIAHLNAKRVELRAPSMMITFEPLPREFFARDAAPARITRFREKVALLRESGLDHLLVLPFDRRMADVPARSVIEDFLVRQLAVRYVVVGDDFRFGRGGEGAYPLVKAAGDRLGFGVSHMGTLKSEDGRVSSTRIRELLAAGDLAAAERLLGHPYFLCGRVVHGRRLGRTIGAPTANIRLPRFRVPVAGVFVVEAVLDGRTCPGLANVGVRPTVGGREPLLEVHLLDFDGDVYGRRLKVTFRHRVRAERAFPSLDALRAQIVDDIASARAYLATAA